MRIKFLRAKEAVMQVTSGATIATDGFVGGAFPEELALELEKRFVETVIRKILLLFTVPVRAMEVTED